jgi:Domain of unknown function (DUF2019)
MIESKLEILSVEQLVARFVDIGVRQSDALLRLETTKFNRLFDQMEAVKEELKRRPGDQRSSLLSLYDHPNAQVRLKAATATLAIAPQAARQLIEAIAASREYPQAGYAGMALTNLDNGIFKPT